MTKKILIVEDEFVVANAVRLALVNAGAYQVIGIATSAEESEEYLQHNKPDLVLLDIRLDGALSGIDLAKKLSAEHIPFIYLSANSGQKILEEAKKTDPYGFLVKPFREKDLLVALDIAFYRQRTNLEARLLQESMLQQQLFSIGNETTDAKEKFLKIALALRPFIPFDLIVSGGEVHHQQQLNDVGYLRVGFEEYQYIGEKELMTIARLSQAKLSDIVANSTAYTNPTIKNDFIIDQAPADPLQKLWLDSFKIQSHLLCHFTLDDGSRFHYLFCSCQRETYTPKHSAVLKLFTKCLTNVTEKMIQSKGSTTLPSGTKPDKALDRSQFRHIIGKHPLLLLALDLVNQVAPYDTSVLILGESGTGKEKIAESVHAKSTRKNGPLIKVNCAAIPHTLIESELFGHEKGAFTGATDKRIGKFELADRGTIFLDEIGELPLEMQVKLLRVLQEREVERIGNEVPKKVDIRIVAATNRNLEKEVAEGNFRLDLYYRLNVFPITLPALRERKSDIQELSLFFAEKFHKEFKKPFTGISPAMTGDMLAYHWPGNIRELENVLQQSVILNDGNSLLELKQSLTQLPSYSSPPSKLESFEDLKHIQQQTERDFIISVLIKTKGRIRGVDGAAELLNIKPTTLESKMAKLGIKGDDF